MSSTYADRKLAEALSQARGASAKARRTVMEWALQDDQLLRDLAGPYLAGIVGRAVEEAARNQVKHPEPAFLAGSALDGIVRMMSENFANGPFGPRPGLRGKPSPEHAATIRTLANAHIRRRSEAFFGAV